MLKERVVYLDGTYVPWDEARVHIMSHSFGRGSAIFEVIGFHETAAGPAVFRLDEYIVRFLNSASLLEMESPLAEGELHNSGDTSRNSWSSLMTFPRLLFAEGATS